MFMLDSNKEYIIQKRNKLLLVNSCNKINEKFYCKTNYIRANNRLYNIILKLNNQECKYHKVMEGFVYIKYENCKVVIIISKNIMNLNIKYEDYVKHKQIIGIYKFKTDKNCIINQYVRKLCK